MRKISLQSKLDDLEYSASLKANQEFVCKSDRCFIPVENGTILSFKKRQELTLLEKLDQTHCLIKVNEVTAKITHQFLHDNFTCKTQPTKNTNPYRFRKLISLSA